MSYSHTILKRGLLPISESVQVIFYDPRSTGKSELSDSSLSIALISDDLDSLIQTLKLEHVYLYSHSGACSVALDYAQKSARRLEGVFLSNPIFATKAELIHRMTNFGGEIARSFYEDLDVTRIAELSAQVLSKLDPITRPLDELETLEFNLEMCLALLHPLMEDDVYKRLESVSTLCVVLLGAQDPYQDIDAIKTKLKKKGAGNVRLEIFTNSGHDNLLRDPLSTRDLIHAVIKSLKIEHAIG